MTNITSTQFPRQRIYVNRRSINKSRALRATPGDLATLLVIYFFEVHSNKLPNKVNFIFSNWHPGDINIDNVLPSNYIVMYGNGFKAVS